MKIDDKLLDSLTEKAKVSERLRMNMDLRNSPADTSQRMLNAIEPGSEVPIHRHRGVLRRSGVPMHRCYRAFCRWSCQSA